MKKTWKQITALTLAFIALLFTAGCGSNDDDKLNVRIAYFPNITHTQALILKNQGKLEEAWKDACNVSWTSFNAGPAEIEAIFAGEIDLGYIGPVPAINANFKSSGDVKIISNATNAGAVLLARKGSGISSAKDLAGKKVAVPQIGNTQHLCLLSLLSENLMDNGSVDAAVVPEPWGATIEKNGNAEVVLDYDELFLEGNYPTAVVIANGDFMEKHPEYVKDFLAMHEEATLFINEHAKEAQEIVNSEIKGVTGKSIDTDILESAFSRMTADTTLHTNAIMTFANISKEEGFISSVPEERNVFNTEFNQ